MNGRILDYSIQTNTGAISGDDGNRYTFSGEDWREPGLPQLGMRVDFEANDGVATGIYAEIGAAPAALGHETTMLGHETTMAAPAVKSKITAGLLAIIFGNFGIHKFYLGYAGIGFLHIVGFWLLLFASCTVGCVVGLVTFGVGLLIPLVVILIYQLVPIVEGIIYLTKSDEDFHETYVVNSRVFF